MGQVFHYAKQGITFTEHRYSAHGKETERENERRKRERESKREREKEREHQVNWKHVSRKEERERTPYFIRLCFFCVPLSYELTNKLWADPGLLSPRNGA